MPGCSTLEYSSSQSRRSIHSSHTQTSGHWQDVWQSERLADQTFLGSLAVAISPTSLSSLHAVVFPMELKQPTIFATSSTEWVSMTKKSSRSQVRTTLAVATQTDLDSKVHG